MNKNQQQNMLAVIGLLFGAFCWGVVWYPYRLLAQAGISGVASSFYTYAIATFFGCFIYAKHWRGLFKQPKSIVLLAIASGWTNLSYVMAVLDGEVMRMMLLFYLSPIWSLLLAHLWLKEKTRFSGYVMVVVSLIGAFIMLYDSKSGGLPIPKNTADWLALSSGVAFSFANIISRQSQHLTLVAKSFAVWLGACVMSLVFILLVGVSLVEPSSFNAIQWLLMFGIGLVVVAATLCVQYGVTRIAVNYASILFLFELVVGAVASYYLANEAMTWNEWLGGILIVLAAIFAASQQTAD